MPVRRRPVVPINLPKPEPPHALASPKVEPSPTSTASPTGSLFMSAKDVQVRLMVSHHEVREMVRARILIPVPYLRGRIKPLRFAREHVDAVAQRQIADAIARVN
jgi:hypothetical protein